MHKANVTTKYYATATSVAIITCRQKNNKMRLVGSTNCEKSFLLHPLEIMFKSFVNPANGKYAWVDLEELEVAYLIDFRWSSKMIS